MCHNTYEVNYKAMKNYCLKHIILFMSSWGRVDLEGIAELPQQNITQHN